MPILSDLSEKPTEAAIQKIRGSASHNWSLHISKLHRVQHRLKSCWGFLCTSTLVKVRTDTNIKKHQSDQWPPAVMHHVTTLSLPVHHYMNECSVVYSNKFGWTITVSCYRPRYTSYILHHYVFINSRGCMSQHTFTSHRQKIMHANKSIYWIYLFFQQLSVTVYLHLRTVEQKLCTMLLMEHAIKMNVEINETYRIRLEQRNGIHQKHRPKPAPQTCN